MSGPFAPTWASEPVKLVLVDGEGLGHTPKSAATLSTHVATQLEEVDAARDYAHDLESDRRRGQWIDPASAKTTVSAWSSMWVETLDIEIRTEENYRAYLRNHILPRWGYTALGDITAVDVMTWLKAATSGCSLVSEVDAHHRRLVPHRRGHVLLDGGRIGAPVHLLRAVVLACRVLDPRTASLSLLGFVLRARP